MPSTETQWFEVYLAPLLPAFDWIKQLTQDDIPFFYFSLRVSSLGLRTRLHSGKKAKNGVKYVGNYSGFCTRLASLADFSSPFSPNAGLVQG